MWGVNMKSVVGAEVCNPIVCGFTLTCIKYLPCGVIYFLYLVHISYNLFPSCCQRCITQIVPTMCYHTWNNYFPFIY